MSNFQGIVFDIVTETIIERAPVLRATEEQAYADGIALLQHVDPTYDESDVYVYDADSNAILYD